MQGDQFSIDKSLAAFFNPSLFHQDDVFHFGPSKVFCAVNDGWSEIRVWDDGTSKLLATWAPDHERLIIYKVDSIKELIGDVKSYLSMALDTYIKNFLGVSITARIGGLQSFIPPTSPDGSKPQFFCKIHGLAPLQLPLIFKCDKLICLSSTECYKIYNSAFLSKDGPHAMLEFIKILPDGTYSEEQIDKLRQASLDYKLMGTTNR